MCRYAFKEYKQSYSCFECRKTFKKTTFHDYLKQTGKLDVVQKLRRCINKKQSDELEKTLGTNLDALEEEYNQLISVCPKCGGQMFNMGMDFKSPKTSNVKEWNIIKGMYSIGAVYQTCGCEGIGYVPKNKSDYVKYLESRLLHWKAYLDSIEKDKSLSSYQRHERCDYWKGRIAEIENAMRTMA